MCGCAFDNLSFWGGTIAGRRRCLKGPSFATLNVQIRASSRASSTNARTEVDMNKIVLAAVATALSATPLLAADFYGAVPPPPPVVAEQGTAVAPPPPSCRAAVVSGLVVGPVDRASRGANRTWCPASDPRSSRQRIPAAGLCPGGGMVCDRGGRLPGQCHDLGGLRLRKGLVLSHVDYSGSPSGRSGSRRHSSGVNIALVRELIETEEASARLEARGGVSAGPKNSPASLLERG